MARLDHPVRFVEHEEMQVFDVFGEGWVLFDVVSSALGVGKGREGDGGKGTREREERV